jgi:hypothetical protein
LQAKFIETKTMTSGAEIYQTQQENSLNVGVLRFFFISRGITNIIKVIQYQYVNDLETRPVFNLGFADYDLDTGTISDEEVSNNDDAYKVFNTVLSTVPRLFEFVPDAVLFVQGSDSKPEFMAQCRTTCSRKCGGMSCKKSHRRINIYRGFVDKNYESLAKEYSFLGGEDLGNQNLIEPYQKHKKYNAVWVMRKNA